MTALRFEPSGFELFVPAGTRVVDVCDDHPECGIPFSCRSANCGSCCVEVVDGREAFPRPEDDERSVLELHGRTAKSRLACQLRVVRDVPRITLRVLDR